MRKENSPPREEGWLRHKENFGEAHLSAADGVVAHTGTWLVSDHPVRANSEGEFSLMAPPPLLTRRGILLCFLTMLLFTGMSLAQVDEAREAIDRGEYVRAVNILSETLANRPDADAYLYLGIAY